MPKKTKEENKTLNTSSTKITQEEYENAKKELEFYKSEYEWITSREVTVAIREVREEAQKIRAMINSEKTKEQLYYQKYYNTLVVKEFLIEQGQYATIMLEGVNRLAEKVKQFEIDVQEFTIRDIFRSMIGLDDQTKEARKVNTLLRKVRIDGLPKEVNLNLQSPEQILDYMRKYGNYVGITIPNAEQEQTKELTVSNGYLTKAQREYFAYVNGTFLGKDRNLIQKESVRTENNKQEKVKTSDKNVVTPREVGNTEKQVVNSQLREKDIHKKEENHGKEGEINQ